ncbi:MAG: DUF1566 domain-containing protein, partial [Paludibacteraceae bacterium]|nr:DUF1566 domain-containing protein [Paludibacteraceae bacterium]
VVWQGSLASAPASPQLNWGYYNSTDKKSYIYDGSTWNLIAQDGIQGIQGIAGVSVVWQGSLASAPASPQLNWGYYNTTDKKSYIYNGSAWDVIAQDGIGGVTTAGTNITITGSGTAASPYVVSETPHSIGESYGGGIVFYVYDGGRHGLIAATADQSTGIRWYGGSNTVTRARADGVGAGLKNTALIIANQAVVDGSAFAATVCNEYSVTSGGVTYGDWYLPSKHELNLLYLQKTVVGGFTSNFYWSSTESSDTNANAQTFGTGTQMTFAKSTSTFYVRAIRAF